ncbi:MAG: PAS domain-containing protein [Firmicutes bacterium]|nr:PAS domain-containing protein [Bacillota bacterium]
MKVPIWQDITKRHGIGDFLKCDVGNLLEELFPFDSGFIAACDSELNPIIEHPVKPSKYSKDIAAFSQSTLNQLVDAAETGPQALDKRLLDLLGADPGSSGMLAPLSHANIRGFILLLFKGQRVPIEGEMKLLKAVAELVSRHYGSLIGLLNTAGIANEVLDSLDIGIYTVSKDGTMIQFNRAAETLFRYDSNNIIGRHYLECLAPQQRDNVKRVIDYVMEKKLAYSGGHIRFITLNQEEMVLSSTVFPWLDEKGELLGVVGLVQDETGKHSFQNRLIQLEKMTVINKIATNLSQDVQGPLAAIRGFARMIEKREASDANSRKFAQIIVDEVDKINQVVNNLLDLSRPMEMEFDRLSLSEVIKNTCTTILNNESKVFLNLHLDESEPIIEGNREKLSQLFSNIFNNSIEAMGHSGVIDVTSQVTGDRVRVVVKDNGCGISKSLLDKIFDPFFTTKVDGAGTGLAVARQIVIRHGGWIVVRSKENEGTTVMLDFPLARG